MICVHCTLYCTCSTMEQFGGVENLSATFAMKESSEEDKGIMLCFKSLPLVYAKLTFTIMKVPRFEFLGGARFLAFVGWRWSCRNSRQPPCSDHNKVSTLFSEYFSFIKLFLPQRLYLQSGVSLLCRPWQTSASKVFVPSTCSTAASGCL